MATPLQVTDPQTVNKLETPRTVVDVKEVKLVLVSYVDESGYRQTQLGVVGDQNVHLLDGKPTGFSRASTPQGVANPWLRDGIFEKLGRKP